MRTWSEIDLALSAPAAPFPDGRPPLLWADAEDRLSSLTSEGVVRLADRAVESYWNVIEGSAEISLSYGREFFRFFNTVMGRVFLLCLCGLGGSMAAKHFPPSAWSPVAVPAWAYFPLTALAGVVTLSIVVVGWMRGGLTHSVEDDRLWNSLKWAVFLTAFCLEMAYPMVFRP